MSLGYGGILLSGVLLLGSGGVAEAQTPTQPQPAPESARPVQPPVIEVPLKLDETIQLNITERRITEENFQASTAVGIGPQEGLRLRIGVGVTAQKFDMLLRNVQGLVRFRADVESKLRGIFPRRNRTPGQQPTTSPRRSPRN